jgi:parallel beta-helix repeat protein
MRQKITQQSSPKSRACLTLILIAALMLLGQEVSARPSPRLQSIAAASSACPALPPPSGNIVNVSTVAQLENAVNHATSGTTILIADGAYNLNGVYLRMAVPNVTLRSASGNREAVILDGNYQTTEIVQVVASNVTVADLTLREAYYHPIHVMSTDSANTDNTLIYNVHIVDPGQQAIKINPVPGGYTPNDGVIACSHIELTDAGRAQVLSINGSCYTGGPDAHQARGWIVRDNLIEGFWCSGSLSEHGIHFWDNSAGTLVERNTLVDCARGIGFGLGSSPHTGGLIRNNMVSVNQDVGIGLENSSNTKVYNNSVYNGNDYMASIEYRFAGTSGASIINNLTNKAILQRDGGSGTVQNNINTAQASWFVNAATGDLHLASSIASVVNKGQALTADVAGDFDGDPRPIGGAYDIGADEYGTPAPQAVTDLRVTNASASTGTLTAILRWTPPANAVTSTLRYSQTAIAEANWAGAALLTGTLSAATTLYTGTIPYTTGALYFALKSQNVDGVWSAVSNNAFWPQLDVYLPVVMKQP